MAVNLCAKLQGLTGGVRAICPGVQHWAAVAQARHAAELARGGRYDEVGAVFGRNRPAAGFSLDLKELVTVLPPRALKAAVRAPWAEDSDLSAAIATLRAMGDTVVCVLPGHEHEVNEFDCDRELARVDGLWTVTALTKSA